MYPGHKYKHGPNTNVSLGNLTTGQSGFTSCKRERQTETGRKKETDRQTDGWTDGRTDRQTEGQTFRRSGWDGGSGTTNKNELV